ncbi:GIY-YIG nuclease family protein, partial [Candidatus Daviesbacteria bacterium]|nr:GIY-YIG nuclease family protein [Candidatus Daviesbacteria bacterium]
MLPDKIAFIDIETTGMRASFDRIIEIGILKAEKKSLKTNKYKLTKTFQTLVNPNGILSPEITTLTGINQALLESAPYFREIKSEVLEILDGCAIAAHNVRFDYGFLKQEFKRLDTSFSSKHFCTVKLSKLLFPKFSHHNLDSLIANLNIKCLNRHRAFDDAKVLWEFFQIILKSFSKEQIEKSLKQVLKQVSLPIKLSTDVLSTLPESSGVYIFLGSNNLPLYIGKSINIKERVMSHFSSDLRSNLEMKISQQIERIETITTTGELGALLKESSLIKKMQPLYNRKLRISKKLLLLKTTLEKNYTKIIFEPTD